MAFLCPVRIKRNKKKKPLPDTDSLTGFHASIPGRITGSASIETLVRVGIEKENGLGPESKMVVLHDFTPCVDDELDVKRGQIVHVLYQENDWVYVISDSNAEGFIPHSYCAPYASQLAGLALNVKKKIPREVEGSSEMCSQESRLMANMMERINLSSKDSKVSGGPSDCNAVFVSSDSENGSSQIVDFDAGVPKYTNTQSLQRSASLPSENSSDILPFIKVMSGRYIVLYSYLAQDENDLSVERGQCVTVLNSDDPDWVWISRYDQHEGFVPAAFIYPLDAVQRQHALNKKIKGSVRTDGHLETSSAQNSSYMPWTVETYNVGCNNKVCEVNSKPSSVDCIETKLVMLYDYMAQASDDLSVLRGDWIMADLSKQTVDGWLWAFYPKLNKYGFIPRAYAKPPMDL